MDKKITVCVITYNCERYLPDLLESIRTSSFDAFHLLVIDNASTDGTCEYIESYPIKKDIIRLPENMGHSYAVNRAIKECNTDYLVLLDHDTKVDKDLFRNLYEDARASENSKFMVFAPVVIDKGRGEIYYGGGFHFIGKTHTGRTKRGEGETYMIASTAPLLDLSKIPKDLLFDEDMFIYWNDADFFYRIRAVGGKIKLVSDAVVYHFSGTKEYSHRGGSQYSCIRAFYVLRNHRLFVLKNYSLSTLIVFAPCFFIYELYNLAFSIKKRIFIKGYLRSWASTLKLLPGLLKKRRIFQKERSLPDKDLVGSYPLDYNPGVTHNKTERFFVSILEKFLNSYYSLVKRGLWR